MAEAKAGPGAAPGEEGVNVQVLLRCRPLSEREIVERTPQVISCNEALRELTLYQNVGGKQMSRTFRYDRVFGTDCMQEKLFKQAIVPIVAEVMDGFNCTIFAYGQTGTGKTYTMEGGPRLSDDGKTLSAEAGVIPRSIKQIFETIEANNSDSTVKVTFLELYNEELTDLLSMDDGKEDGKRLRLLEDRGGVVVQGLEEMIVKSAAEIYQVLDRGTAKRRTAETLLNKRSSRSHSIFSITIHMRETTPEGEDVVKVGKLNLVDLAGSENISRSGAKDGRAREAGSINQSLLTLGRVITALVEHSGHVPYRDSKLTRLLRDSLGGRTKTCIIATIAPTVQCQEETISTLDYAHRAKNIRNRPEVNQKISKQAMIKEMVGEIEKLKMDLIATREKNGVFLSQERFNEEQMELVRLRDSHRVAQESLAAERESHKQELEAQQAEAAAREAKLKAELQRANKAVFDAKAQLAAANELAEERSFIIRHLRVSHDNIFGAAMTTQQQLTRAADDVSALFSLASDLRQLQGADCQAMCQVQDSVKDRLISMAESLSGAVNSQSQQLNALANRMAAFKAEKQRDIKQLQQQLACAHGSIQQLKELLSSRALATAEVGQEALRQATTTAGEYYSQAREGADALEKAVRSAVEQLTSELEEQADQLEAFAARQARDSRACVASLHSSMQQLSAGFGALDAAAAKASTASQERYSALHSSLAKVMAARMEEEKQREAQLLQQIAALVTAHTQHSSAALAAEVQALQQTVQRDSNAMATELQVLQSTAAAGSGGVKDAQVAFTTSFEPLAQDVQQQAGVLKGALRSCSGTCLSMQLDMVQQVQDSTALTQSMQQSLDSVVERGAADLQAAAGACAEAAGAAAAQLSAQHKALSQRVEAAAASDMAMADELSVSAAGVSTSLQELQATQNAGMEELSARVCTTVSQQLNVSRPAVPASCPMYVYKSAAEIEKLLCPKDNAISAQFFRDRQAHKDPTAEFEAKIASPAPGSLAFQLSSAATASPPRSADTLASRLAAASENETPAAPAESTSPQRSEVRSMPMRSRIPAKPMPTPTKGGADASNASAQRAMVDRTNRSGAV